MIGIVHAAPPRRRNGDRSWKLQQSWRWRRWCSECSCRSTALAS